MAIISIFRMAAGKLNLLGIYNIQQCVTLSVTAHVVNNINSDGYENNILSTFLAFFFGSPGGGASQCSIASDVSGSVWSPSMAATPRSSRVALAVVYVCIK